MLGCDEWFMYRNKQHLSKGLNAHDALKKLLDEFWAIRHLSVMEIVEPGTDSIISKMQDEGFTIMGLTTQGLTLATCTWQQLLANNIDLTRTAPIPHDYFLNLNEHGVLYRHGILFTSGTSKGEALFQLLEQNDVFVDRVLFINDKASHLKEVEDAAIKRGVEFIGLRYAYSDARKALFDPEIADIQFTWSNFGRIVSDSEAKDILNRQKGLVTCYGDSQ